LTIERKVGSGAWELLLNLDASVKAYDDTNNLQENTTYSYRAKRVSPTYETAYSPVVTVVYGSSPPSINIASYTKSKISDEVGMTRSTVTFQSNQDLVEWEARADGNGHGVGLLVGSGASASASTNVSFDVDYNELTLGDKSYRINVYGKNAEGTWNNYGS
jgi:hypothetical protein